MERAQGQPPTAARRRSATSSTSPKGDALCLAAKYLVGLRGAILALAAHAARRLHRHVSRPPRYRELCGRRRGRRQQESPTWSIRGRRRRRPRHRVRRRAHGGGGGRYRTRQGVTPPGGTGTSSVIDTSRCCCSRAAEVTRRDIDVRRATRIPRTAPRPRVVAQVPRRRLRAPGALDVRHRRQGRAHASRSARSPSEVRKLETDGATVVIVDIDPRERSGLHRAQRADAAARRHAAGDRRDSGVRRALARQLLQMRVADFVVKPVAAARSGARLRARRARRAERAATTEARSTRSCPRPAASG